MDNAINCHSVLSQLNSRMIVKVFRSKFPLKSELAHVFTTRLSHVSGAEIVENLEFGKKNN